MTTLRLASAAFLIALTQAACEATEHQQIRAKAAETFTCSPDAIEIREVKDTPDYTIFVAKGCHESKLYVCERSHEAVAGRDRGGARGNMRDVVSCREKGDSPLP